MKSYVEKKYTLELDVEEAAWLKTVMQNPLDKQNPEDESDYDMKMRKLFFNAIKD